MMNGPPGSMPMLSSAAAKAVRASERPGYSIRPGSISHQAGNFPKKFGFQLIVEVSAISFPVRCSLRWLGMASYLVFG